MKHARNGYTFRNMHNSNDIFVVKENKTTLSNRER
jgi:hypothetical protein